MQFQQGFQQKWKVLPLKERSIMFKGPVAWVEKYGIKSISLIRQKVKKNYMDFAGSSRQKEVVSLLWRTRRMGWRAKKECQKQSRLKTVYDFDVRFFLGKSKLYGLGNLDGICRSGWCLCSDIFTAKNH